MGRWAELSNDDPAPLDRDRPRHPDRAVRINTHSTSSLLRHRLNVRVSATRTVMLKPKHPAPLDTAQRSDSRSASADASGQRPDAPAAPEALRASSGAGCFGFSMTVRVALTLTFSL